MTAYLYARTSTEEQHNGLDAQLDALRKWAHPGPALEIVEHASAKRMDTRPLFQKILYDLQAGDTLVATSISRLSRSVVDFAWLLEQSEKGGWTLVVLDAQLDTSTAVGRMCAGIMAQFAQFERELISERTKAALAVLQARGVKLGRPSHLPAEVAEKIRELRETKTLVETAAVLNEEGVPTPSGLGKWHGSMVRRHENR